MMRDRERERENTAKLIYNKPAISVWQGSTYLNKKKIRQTL